MDPFKKNQQLIHPHFLEEGASEDSESGLISYKK